MEEVHFYTLIWIVALVIATAAAIVFVLQIQMLAVESVHPATWQWRPHFWRSIVPSFFAILFAWFNMDVTLSPLTQHLWMTVFGLVIPFAITWSILRETLRKRFDRIAFIITLLALMNVAFLTAGWGYAKRFQEVNYNGLASIIDWYPASGDGQDTMKVKLQWTCPAQKHSDDEPYVCRATRVVDCGVISKRTSCTSRDYDMTIYNGDSFIDCENGFDDEVWEENGWTNYNNWEDDDEVFAENNGEGNPYLNTNQPSMAIVGDCYRCEIDKHSGGNLYRLKRNWFIIPGWVGIAILCVCSYFVGTQRTAAISKEELLHGQMKAEMA